MKAHSALSGPTAAFALAGLWAMTIALWFAVRPERGGTLTLACAVVSVPVWLVIGVQRLRARRAAGEGPAPPA
ncbi:hypothetical protein AB0D88_25440 [Streptomyces werraensis]|uniref:hypothetical protein n=1 Tax=Streptomyces werraensis TaxID=68284 RepID=UPI003424F764